MDNHDNQPRSKSFPEADAGRSATTTQEEYDSQQGSASHAELSQIEDDSLAPPSNVVRRRASSGDEAFAMVEVSSGEESPIGSRQAVHKPNEGQFEYDRATSTKSSVDHRAMTLSEGEQRTFLKVKALIAKGSHPKKFVPFCLQRAYFSPEETDFMRTKMGRQILINATNLARKILKAWGDRLNEFEKNGEGGLTALNGSFRDLAQAHYAEAIDAIYKTENYTRAQMRLIVAIYRKTITALSLPHVSRAGHTSQVYDTVERSQLAADRLVDRLSRAPMVNEPPVERFNIDIEFFNELIPAEEPGDIPLDDMSETSSGISSQLLHSERSATSQRSGTCTILSTDPRLRLEGFTAEDDYKANWLLTMKIHDELQKANSDDKTDSDASEEHIGDFSPMWHWNYYDAVGMTLLAYAVLAGNAVAVHELLQLGADWTCSVRQLSSGDLVPLIELRNRAGDTILHLLAKGGYAEWAMHMFETVMFDISSTETPVDGWRNLLMMKNNDGFRPAELVDKEGNSLLHYVAAMADDSSDVWLSRLIIHGGANHQQPNLNGETPEQLVTNRDKSISRNIASSLAMSDAVLRVGGTESASSRQIQKYNPYGLLNRPPLSPFRQGLWVQVRQKLLPAIQDYERKKNGVLYPLYKLVNRVDEATVKSDEEEIFELLQLLSEADGSEYHDNKLYDKLKLLSDRAGKGTLLAEVLDIFTKAYTEAKADDFHFSLGESFERTVASQGTVPESVYRAEKEKNEDYAARLQSSIAAVAEDVEYKQRLQEQLEQERQEKAQYQKESAVARREAAEANKKADTASADAKQARADARSAETRAESAETRAESAETQAKQAKADAKAAKDAAEDMKRMMEEFRREQRERDKMKPGGGNEEKSSSRPQGSPVAPDSPLHSPRRQEEQPASEAGANDSTAKRTPSPA
ncbi:MAG: hypothetical protein CMF50_09915 [Legionellales bacterium]|nr:hypothetical protein [Legionellales bacterium]